MASNDWPAHSTREVAWSQAYRSGPEADRRVTSITVAIPPRIASVSTAAVVDSAVATQLETAAAEIAALDRDLGQHLAGLQAMLLRTEAVASSKIEQIEATSDDYIRALHGNRSNAAATEMAAGTEATRVLVNSVIPGGPITLKSILGAHRILMAADRHEQLYAGRLRDMQNWIGGSDHSPRNAAYIPPPAEFVAGAMDDLVAFANRDDLPALAQAALAHAQFESIHPFTDGNGRIGRAVINTVLRRRGLTQHAVVPLASALVARRDAYFDLLATYRQGHAAPIVMAFADAARIAAAESRITAAHVAALPHRWRDEIGRVRAGSAAHRLLDALTALPAFSAADVQDTIGGSLPSIYAAIEQLITAGIAEPLTDRKRNQIWGVRTLLDELDDLSARIAARAR
ncbi:MAG: Fic family protein [Nitriliruptoraceae bacterium]